MLPSAVQQAPPKKSHIKEKEQRASPWFSPLSSVPCSVLSLGTRSTKAIHHLSFCVALVLYLISSLPLHHIALTWEGTTGLSGRNCGWTVKIQILDWASKSLSMTLETSLSFPYLSYRDANKEIVLRQMAVEVIWVPKTKMDSSKMCNQDREKPSLR